MSVRRRCTAIHPDRRRWSRKTQRSSLTHFVVRARSPDEDDARSDQDEAQGRSDRYVVVPEITLSLPRHALVPPTRAAAEP